MEILVTPLTITAFDEDLGEEGLLTLSFTTAAQITYKANTTLYFYAVITEGANTQTVCLTLTGGANPLPIGTTSFTIPNTEGFTDQATAAGTVYYTAA